MRPHVHRFSMVTTNTLPRSNSFQRKCYTYPDPCIARFVANMSNIVRPVWLCLHTHYHQRATSYSYNVHTCIQVLTYHSHRTCLPTNTHNYMNPSDWPVQPRELETTSKVRCHRAPTWLRGRPMDSTVFASSLAGLNGVPGSPHFLEQFTCTPTQTCLYVDMVYLYTYICLFCFFVFCLCVCLIEIMF